MASGLRAYPGLHNNIQSRLPSNLEDLIIKGLSTNLLLFAGESLVLRILMIIIRQRLIAVCYYCED
jgi:hypothetical protein